MHAQKTTRTGKARIPPIIDRSVEEEILLKRWEESDREYVEDELARRKLLSAQQGQPSLE